MQKRFAENMGLSHMFRRKKLPPKPPDDGLIHMCGEIYTPAQIWLHANFAMQNADAPNWRNDPTYDLKGQKNAKKES